MRHINIPIFIPHLGCPNQCIFCNQRHISGTQEFDISSVRNTIEEVLLTAGDDTECEIAFFGGSFTGIDRGLMVELLDIAEEYVRANKVVGIRMSTRPDYISQEIINILKQYTVTFVELGIQTMSDEILTYLKRGHSTADTINAAKLLKENSIPFVGQMMIGLPQATIEDELYCAEQLCKLGACATRIYPTIVFSHTELADLTKVGEYKALSVEEAVERSAKVLKIFKQNNVNCIRIGLSDSENLHSDETYIAGPNSPSIGEMVKSKLYLENICEELDNQEKNTKNKILCIECPKGCVSQVIGHRRKNINDLKNRFGFSFVKVVENPKLEDKIKFEIKEENSCD